MIPIGLINDDSNEVGSVHLGLFYKMKVGKDVEVIEKEKLLGKWFSISELKKSEEERMETWAEIGIQAL
jgi:predicted NUDIX family phosphoesterase